MKKAILFLNLGGPETLNDVKSFLFRLFSDPDIIRIKFTPLRLFVAWLIATLREKKSKSLYAEIGGGSPIRMYTDMQAEGVQALLEKSGNPTLVRTAFTCSPPFVEDVVKQLEQEGVDQFLTFPLYPQYSMTTTKGALERTRKAVARYAPDATLYEMKSWPTHPLFLEAHADQIRQQVTKFSNPVDSEIHLLFSAHSIPEKLVTEEGDPYKNEMEQSAKGVVEKANWKGPWTLAWQSKLGPVKWLEPFTDNVIRDLAKKGVKQVLVVPIAFVTDHIETIHEIDLDFGELAKHEGIREFRRTPGLNGHPVFLRALTDLALSKKEFWD